jgi:preprotein translocase subunit SecY
MSPLEEFLYGCIGGALAFTVIMLLPELRQTWKEKKFDRLPAEGSALVVLLAVIQILLGGAAALWMGDAVTAKQAVAYGIAAETLLGGGARAAKGGAAA